MVARTLPGGTFTMAEDLTVTRVGYGAMQLAGPGVFGPPKDRDAAVTVPVGDIPPLTEKLLRVTEESLAAGIGQLREGNRLHDVGSAVQTVAEGAGFSVVRGYVGHAIGTEMHEEPAVPNYWPGNPGPKLRTGMVFAVEPMVNAGVAATVQLDDGWSVVTADGALSAHFEHTIAVTEDGPEVFTVL